MPSQKEAALSYAKRGWPIFPCRADKSPYTEHGVHDASSDPVKVDAWWSENPNANIGLNCGEAGFMVLDLDPGHDLAALDKAVGGLPETHLVSGTPRGGYHWFYQLAQGEAVAMSASKLAPHVDVRSFNSYVILPPGRTTDGTYEWVEEGNVAFRTDEMVRLANVAKEKSVDRDRWIIKPDLPENIDLAIGWLRNDARIAVEGSGGDLMAYKTAAMMKSFGISRELAVDLMWEHWNPRCMPPWSGDEIDHFNAKVDNGYSFNTSNPGNMTDAYKVAKNHELFEAIEQVDVESGREQRGQYRVVDREAAEHIKPPEWLIDDLMPQEGYAILFGSPGTFKTFVALDLALNVATGGFVGSDNIWCGKSRGVGPVLFAAGEGRPQIIKRVQAWEKTHYSGARVKNFFLVDPVPKITVDIEPFINEMLKMSPEGYKLVVIDTVGRAMQGTNENSQEHASKFTAMVEILQRAFKCAVLALHHTGHEAGVRARGSSVFGADADTMLRLDREGKENFVHISMTKQKDAAEWGKGVVAELREVDGTDTLAVANPSREQKVAEDGKATQAFAKQEILDKAIGMVLQPNKLLEWTTKDLAEAIACDKANNGVTETSHNLKLRKLVTLRERPGTLANRCYNPIKKKWRWKD